MGTKTYILKFLVSAMFVASIVPRARADSETTREYQIKAAFLYNFIKFVDWPGEKTVDRNEPIIIGIMGENPFGKAFEQVKDQKLRGRSVVILDFNSFRRIEESAGKDETAYDKQIAAIKKCRLLFVCRSEKVHLREIIAATRNVPVLTAGEMPGFLEAGGIINFLIEDKKVRFEINLEAAEKRGLKISSKLLRLAKRVIRKKSPETPEN